MCSILYSLSPSLCVCVCLILDFFFLFLDKYGVFACSKRMCNFRVGIQLTKIIHFTWPDNLRMTKINSIGFLFKLFSLFRIRFVRTALAVIVSNIVLQFAGVISISMGIYFDLKIIHVMACSTFIWLLLLPFCVCKIVFVPFIHSFFLSFTEVRLFDYISLSFSSVDLLNMVFVLRASQLYI